MVALDYAKRTNADLIEILKSRSLPTTGKKAELVARLREDDAKRNAALPSAAKTDTADDVIDWDDDAPAEETVKPSSEAGSAAVAAEGEEAVPSPVAVPNQEPEIDPATTNDLEVESKDPAPPEDSKPEDDTPAAAAAEETSQPAEKPQVDYSIGLPSTELEAELKKRKARAEKFGIVKDTETALADAEKAVQRAKRFGTGDDASGVSVKGLDEALPSERPRKRGRDDEDNRRGNKRRNFGGRGRNTRSTRGRDGGRGRKPVFNEKDALANEARKNRFAAAA